MAKAPAKQPTVTVHREFATVAAIAWFAVFVLTFLSLITYNPHDIGLLSTTRNETPANFTGWAGAYWANWILIAFGLAGFILPLLFCAASAGFAFNCHWRWRWKLLWSFLLVLSAACLLDLQPYFGKNWDWLTFGPGGFVGKELGGDFFHSLLGPGAFIVLSIVYISSLILLFNLNLRQIAITSWNLYVDYRKRKEEKLAANDPLAALEFKKKQIQTQLREEEKKLLRKGVTPKSEKSEPAQEIQPRIIDTTTSPVEKNPRKSRPESQPEPKPEPPQAIPTPVAAETPAAESPKEKEKPDPTITDNTAVRRSKSRTKDNSAHASSENEPQDFSKYQLPTLDLLQANSPEKRPVTNREELIANARLLVETLHQFDIEVEAGEITKGATITRYEVKPADGVRVDKIVSLQRDICRVMKAERVNILAPIPGKDTVGIEVANSKKAPIVLRDLFESGEWSDNKRSKIPLALGKDVYGHTLVADLAEMPHLLIAGTTGSGKSVCINCILMSFLYRFKPDELRLILVDPKQVELQVYNTVPHLVVPVVTDPKKVLLALKWVIKEMDDRYKILAKVGMRNITSFNNRPRHKQQQLELGVSPAKTEKDSDDASDDSETEEKLEIRVPRDDEIQIPDKLPFIVVVIDELADLMQTAPADVESAIARLTAKARAAGIHLILATQTPRREVITGVIKTNIPSRIAFQVPSALDSRVILDENGAENLLGKGDLLYLPPGSAKYTRGQGAFVSDDEVKKVVDFCAAQSEPQFHPEINGRLNRDESEGEEVSSEDYELIVKSFEVVRQEKRASTSLLQRRLRLGYNRAAWVMDHFEGLGIVGPENGAKPREILVDLDTYELPMQ
jgi:DNA segregation ATPase FtsK/SpoIIIE, S-DNA-T family